MRSQQNEDFTSRFSRSNVVIINSYDSASPLAFCDLSTSGVFATASFLFIFESFFPDLGVALVDDLEL